MADAKITALTENTTPALVDLLVQVDDPAGTPITKKMTTQSLLDLLQASTPNNTNLLTNGNFDIWQLATSFTAASEYTADCWLSYSAVTGRTYSQQAVVLNGSTYSLRAQRDSGNAVTNAYGIYNTIESRDSMKHRGKKLTFSFWAKCGANYSQTDSKLTVRLTTGTGTDENQISAFTGSDIIINAVQAITTSWVKYTFTTSAVLADTVNEIGVSFISTPVGTAGANDWFEIAQVQVIEGAVTLPFIPKDYNLELRDCLRRMWVIGGLIVLGGNVKIGAGLSFSATGLGAVFQMPVPMRIAPTLTATAGDWSLLLPSTARYDVTALIKESADMNFMALTFTVASGLAADKLYFVESDGTAGRKMIFNANL